MHSTYVENWMKTHSSVVEKFMKDNPGIPHPKATDLAVVFFQNFSKENPGKFLSSVTHIDVNGKTQTTIEKVNAGTDIQSTFFDMWRQDNPNVAIQDIPGDLVTTSASGLDPHITLENARISTTKRIASKWAVNLKRKPIDLQREIEQLVQERAYLPVGGLVEEQFVIVLELNIELCNRYGVPPN